MEEQINTNHIVSGKAKDTEQELYINKWGEKPLYESVDKYYLHAQIYNPKQHTVKTAEGYNQYITEFKLRIRFDQFSKNNEETYYNIKKELANLKSHGANEADIHTIHGQPNSKYPNAPDSKDVYTLTCYTSEPLHIKPSEAHARHIVAFTYHVLSKYEFTNVIIPGGTFILKKVSGEVNGTYFKNRICINVKGLALPLDSTPILKTIKF